MQDGSGSGSGGGSFYTPPGRQVFSPGNASPFRVPTTQPPPKRVRNNPAKALLTWAVVLTALAIGAKYAYPAVLDKVHAKEISAVTADLQTVAEAQESYKQLQGSYSGDFTSLNIPKTLDSVTIVSATMAGYCLKGSSLTGGTTLYRTRALGVSKTACT